MSQWILAQVTLTQVTLTQMLMTTVIINTMDSYDPKDLIDNWASKDPGKIDKTQVTQITFIELVRNNTSDHKARGPSDPYDHSDLSDHSELIDSDCQ